MEWVCLHILWGIPGALVLYETMVPLRSVISIGYNTAIQWNHSLTVCLAYYSGCYSVATLETLFWNTHLPLTSRPNTCFGEAILQCSCLCLYRICSYRIPSHRFAAFDYMGIFCGCKQSLPKQSQNQLPGARLPVVIILCIILCLLVITTVMIAN